MVFFFYCEIQYEMRQTVHFYTTYRCCNNAVTSSSSAKSYSRYLFPSRTRKKWRSVKKAPKENTCEEHLRNKFS